MGTNSRILQLYDAAIRLKKEYSMDTGGYQGLRNEVPLLFAASRQGVGRLVYKRSSLRENDGASLQLSHIMEVDGLYVEESFKATLNKGGGFFSYDYGLPRVLISRFITEKATEKAGLESLASEASFIGHCMFQAYSAEQFIGNRLEKETDVRHLGMPIEMKIGDGSGDPTILASFFLREFAASPHRLSDR